MRRSTTADLAAALDLLDRAHATLAQAASAASATDRYVQSHLGALRAAAALLAARPDGIPGAGRRGGVGGRRGRPGNVWEAVTRAAPELGEWSAYLAWCGDRRQAIETDGVPAGRREADDLLRAAQTFVGLVEAALGLPARHAEPVLVAFGSSPRAAS